MQDIKCMLFIIFKFTLPQKNDMKKFRYSIDIRAPREEVWRFMLDKETYRTWVNAAWPGSYYEGEWKHGGSIRFIGADGSGTKATLVKQVPNEHLSIKHIAVLEKGDREDTTSESAKSWIGTMEQYIFTEKDGVTTLTVDIETSPDWEKMFNEGWPVALQSLKAMTER